MRNRIGLNTGQAVIGNMGQFVSLYYDGRSVTLQLVVRVVQRLTESTPWLPRTLYRRLLRDGTELPYARPTSSRGAASLWKFTNYGMPAQTPLVRQRKNFKASLSTTCWSLEAAFNGLGNRKSLSLV